MAMRAGVEPPRNPVLAGEHLVVSGHPVVSAVGNRVLIDGGTAVDATLAMAAMSWIALPGQCGVGGDAFAIVREPDGEIWTVGASGFGPDGGYPDFYREQGLDALPFTGALAVAAPGAVAAMSTLHTHGATRSLDELWAPAVAAAERGLPCTAKNRSDILDHESALRRDSGTRAMFLRGGRAPQIGERLPQPELARTLRVLARDPSCLYAGELAERAVTGLVEAGAPFSGGEWEASGTAAAGAAVTGGYGGYLIHETPPPTPGWMVIQQAMLCDAVLRDLPWLSAAAVDRMARAAHRAFADRFARCGSNSMAWAELLEPATIRAARSDLDAAGHELTIASLTPDGDTTSTLAVDAAGRAVSYIHSLALTFGARITVPGTGIVLNNRLGRGAYLIDNHPNEVRPRRRPLHTLNAWIVTDRAGRLVHVGNTPGGDGQVQWNMQLLSHLIDHDLDPQEAVSAPRFTVSPGSDADSLDGPEVLVCESRLSEFTIAGLRERGHFVREVGAWEAGGSALVISADHELGYLAGAADPRQDGVAAGG